MGDWIIKPAVRANVGLFIGLAGGTASGKTFSALLMAEGIVGPNERFVVIDTENKRALHYADRFNFDHVEFNAPFSSLRYGEVVKYCHSKGYKAIVLDSFSHEHDGEGGYLDMHAQALDALVANAKKKDYNKNKSEYELAEKLTPLAWKQPKMDRRRMLQQLLSCSSTIPIIFCLRAEQKSFTSKDGKLVAHQNPVWEPLCGKGMMFEMTVSFMLDAEAPGVPKVIKLEDQHRPLFPLDKPLGRECGRLIAEWAKGGAKPEPKPAESSAEIRSRLEQAIANANDRPSLNPIGTTITTFKSQLNAQDFRALMAAWKQRAEDLATAAQPQPQTTQPASQSSDNPQAQMFKKSIQQYLDEKYPESDQIEVLSKFCGRQVTSIDDLPFDQIVEAYNASCNDSL